MVKKTEILGEYTERRRKINGKWKLVWVRRSGRYKSGRIKYQKRAHDPHKYKKGERKPSYSKKRDRARLAKHTRGRGSAPWRGDLPGRRV